MVTIRAPHRTPTNILLQRLFFWLRFDLDNPSWTTNMCWMSSGVFISVSSWCPPLGFCNMSVQSLVDLCRCAVVNLPFIHVLISRKGGGAWEPFTLTSSYVAVYDARVHLLSHAPSVQINCKQPADSILVWRGGAYVYLFLPSFCVWRMGALAPPSSLHSQCSASQWCKCCCFKPPLTTIFDLLMATCLTTILT